MSDSERMEGSPGINQENIVTNASSDTRWKASDNGKLLGMMTMKKNPLMYPLSRRQYYYRGQKIKKVILIDMNL